MQLWTTVNLVNINMPYHFNFFATGTLIISSMDLLDMESTYEENFNFTETRPLTEKFEFFDIGDKIFVSNSGSLFAIIALIIAESLIRFSINYACIIFPRNRVA